MNAIERVCEREIENAEGESEQGERRVIEGYSVCKRERERETKKRGKGGG